MQMTGALMLLCAAGVASAATTYRSEPIPGQYLVVMKANATRSQVSMMTSEFGVKQASIGDDFQVMFGTFAADKLASLQSNPDVAYIEQDQVVEIAASCPNSQTSRVSWGQKRVTSTSPRPSKFAHDRAWGSGVTAYIIDTGVFCGHEQFTGRCKWGANYADNSETDGQGHGTHVAGTVAGSDYGIAKSAQIIAVKVLGNDGRGQYSWIIDGMVFASKDATGKRAVANMSLGGGKSRAVNDAADKLWRAGVGVAVAAGNDNKDACAYSPASTKSVVTVGSTASGDGRSSFSNWGTCLDIFAPGSSILSASPFGRRATKTMSGTSMASPHVCGALAVLMGQGVSHGNLKMKLKENAQSGVVGNAGWGSPNKFLHIPCSGQAPPPRRTPQPWNPPPRRTPQPWNPPPRRTPAPRNPPPPSSSCKPDGCYTHGCDYYSRGGGYTCDELKNTYHCDCSGCDCDKGETLPPVSTLPPKGPGSCKPEACFTHGCEHYLKEGYTCHELETEHKCDCTGCKCF